MPDSAAEAPIVPGMPGDLAALAALKRAAYEPWIPIIGPKPRPYDADYAPALVEGRVHLIRGATGLQAALVLERPEEVLHIYSIAVDPKLQGSGLARRLLAFAEALARAEDRRLVTLITNQLMARNIAFYTRWGFVEIEREAQPGGYNVVHMVKPVR